MRIRNYQAELQYCLGQAAELLGGPVRPLALDWDLEQLLDSQLVWESRRGLGHEPPVLWIDRSRRGHSVTVGVECFRWQTPDGPIRLARFSLPNLQGPVGNFWAVRQEEYRRFYRHLRRSARQQEDQDPPVMAKGEQQRLWDNTIGFLRHHQATMVHYGVAPKRGVLLTGEPGNGKTMACRWLHSQCRRYGLEWQTVTAQGYEAARMDRELPNLFRLPSPGIIFFDDFDTALHDRQKFGETDKHSTFLTELDGIEQKEGLIFLFTSNTSPEDLDPAMRRPGRIDVMVHFPAPTAALRRRLIRERWHADILGGIDVEHVVTQTAGLSFAELEEAKKLLVMRYVEAGRWDWDWVRDTLHLRQDDRRLRRPIGFGVPCNAEGHANGLSPVFNRAQGESPRTNGESHMSRE